MREEERIDRMLKKIGRLWKEFPDMRLGQLIENYAIQTRGDIWFQEDSDTEKILNHYIKEYFKKKKV